MEYRSFRKLLIQQIFWYARRECDKRLTIKNGRCHEKTRQVGLQGKFRQVYNPESIVSGDVGVFLDNKDIIMFQIPDGEEIKKLRQDQ